MRAIVAIAIVGLLSSWRGAVAQETAPPLCPDLPHDVLLLGTFHFRDAGLDSYQPQFDPVTR